MTMRLAVDWLNCQAHGMCYEVLPERIIEDDWGYPIIDDRAIPPALEAMARRAADACPTLALLVRIERDTGS